MTTTVGIVGARGFVGRELIALLDAHPDFRMAYVSSRRLAGQAVDGISGELHYESLNADEVAARGADVCVLALPNDLSEPFVSRLDATHPETIIIDLSGDHRFDDNWYYGLPELRRDDTDGRVNRIANPGCYATAMQLAIWPARAFLTQPPVCFGVSGYSGAGTTPSPRNSASALQDNLLAYALTDHLHEREVTRQLGLPVRFTPHVAGFFRGIAMTVVMQTDRLISSSDWNGIYRDYYADNPLVSVSDEAPQVKHISGTPGASVGGFGTDSRGRLVVVATLDNLLKGAATQALQNLNLACGFAELEGIL